MPSFNDFSSLLQLGVGTGIGLSLFRAPIDFRVGRISRRIEAELIALRGADTLFTKRKRRDLQDLKVAFTAMRDSLDRILLPFMIVAVIGAVMNLLGLIGATLHASETLSCFQVCGLVFVTVGWFVLELLALEILARIKLSRFSITLEELRASRAPSVPIPANAIRPQ